MDLDNSPTTILETDIKLEATYLIHNSRTTMELHSSTHEVIVVILPETTHSTLVADDRSIDIRITSLTGIMTMTIGTALPEPRREETGRTLGAIHVLLLVLDETHSRIDIINPRGLVHLIIGYSDDPTAKNLAVLSLMNSGSIEPMTNLALTVHQYGRFNQCIIRPLPVKLMRSPKSDSNRSRSSRLSFNIFYFATGDAQKDSGLEIEFMLDTGASCSIINYRTFWETSQFHHPIMVHRSNKLTKTYSGQVVPMFGYAIIEFSYDPNGEYSFPLTVWITEMKTLNLIGMDFCQNQASGIHFDLPSIELRQPPNTLCYGSLYQNKIFPYVSRSLMVRLLYTMHVDAKSARCWKYSPGDPKSLFSPGSTFQPNREAVATSLTFVNIISTQPEPTLPILIENNKNRQITLPKGRIGFSSLDVADKEEPK